MEETTKNKLLKEWLGTGSVNIFGKPFAGKDTHAAILSEFFNAKVIGGGDILRSQESQHINEHIDRGSMAPTDEYRRIVLPYFEKEEFKGHPLILSSVGRWHGEEVAVLEAAAGSGHTVRAVINIKITDSEAFRRREAEKTIRDRGPRADDNDEQKLKVRLAEYSEKTEPVIEFYREHGMLLEVDGMQPKDIVAENIHDQLYRLAIL